MHCFSQIISDEVLSQCMGIVSLAPNKFMPCAWWARQGLPVSTYLFIFTVEYLSCTWFGKQSLAILIAHHVMLFSMQFYKNAIEFVLECVETM